MPISDGPWHASAPHPLSYNEAVAMLPDGEYVYTFRGTGPSQLGASWPRAELAIRQYGTELTGPPATKMGYGMALIDDTGPLFIATRK